MGSPDDESDRSSNEGPQHKVKIPRRFAVAKLKVTRDEYETFVNETSYSGSDKCFTLEDVESVCTSDALPAAQSLAVLSSLVDKSLLTKEDAGAVACYRLHETMREFARLKLREAGEEFLHQLRRRQQAARPRFGGAGALRRRGGDPGGGLRATRLEGVGVEHHRRDRAEDPRCLAPESRPARLRNRP